MEIKEVYKFNTQGTCEVLHIIGQVKEGYITDHVAAEGAVIMVPRKMVGEKKNWSTSREQAKEKILVDLRNMLDYYEKAIRKIEKIK